MSLVIKNIYFTLNVINIFSLFRLKLKVNPYKLIVNGRNDFYLVWNKD